MISIQAGLHKIKHTMGQPIEISFVRAGGPKMGSIKKVWVVYGSTAPGSKGTSSRGPSVKHKHSGKIPLLTKDGTPCTPFISHIIAVDGEKVKH